MTIRTTVEATPVTVWWCGSCEKYVMDEDATTSPLYECGSCGYVYNRDNSANGAHQCPQCFKFGAKMFDTSCPEGCEEELDEREAYEIGGSLYVPMEDIG